MYSEPGVKSDDYQKFIDLSDIIFIITVCVCFFIIFGKPLSQIFGWFKKNSEKEI